MSATPKTREAAPQQEKAAPITESQAQAANSNDCLQAVISVCEQPEPLISYYSAAAAYAPEGAATLTAFMEAVTSNENKRKVERLRELLAANDEEGFAIAKKLLEAVSLSGKTTTGGRAKSHEQDRFVHSGYMQIDFDGKDNIGWTVTEMRDILQADPRVVAAFVSPSGDGVKGVARIQPNVATHLASFIAVREFFAQHNLTVDESCKDPGRLCFVSWDPDGWIDLERTEIFEPAENIDDKNIDDKNKKTSTPISTGGGIVIRSEAFPEPPMHGIHGWIMTAAWYCRLQGSMTEEEAITKLESYSGSLRRSYQDNEVSDAVTKVYASAMPDGGKDAGTDKPLNKQWADIPDDNAPGQEVPEAYKARALLARAYAMAYDPDKTPPPDETCMVIGDIPIAARGNLTALQGKSKVGKSAVVSAILGAAQRGQYAIKGDTICLEWQGLAEGAIIHLDTEQSPADWHGLVTRSTTRAGMPTISERLVSLPLVMFARSERLMILEGALAEEADKQGKIDAVIIDGIADLCTSPNDEAESLELVSRIHALAHEYECPIYCILHENPSTDQGKTRGHLGSELNRKAFANLRIDKDTETSISTIFGTDMRKRDLPKEQGFCFAWDNEAGMHTFQGRAAGLKAAQREEKAVSDARETWGEIYEIASQRENTAFPALSPKEAAEIEQEISGKDKLTKTDTMKKRMQKAESLGVLRKIDLLSWALNDSWKGGN